MSMPIIELNRENDVDPNNVLKIDGVEIKGIQNVKIEYGLDNHNPIITLQVIARRIKATVKSSNVKMIKGK